jgi:hypothetical protein
MQDGEHSKKTVPIEAIINKEWMRIKVPDTPLVVHMLLPEERQLLYYLASEYWQDRGRIIDAGCFLGGSATALGLGVRARQVKFGHASQTPIHSYDLFKAEEWTIGRFLPSTFSPGQSFRPIFDENIRAVADLVVVHEGDITERPWTSEPIEILFIDCAKTWVISDFISYHFFKALIPGHSIVIQQDYLWDCWNAWLHITMEYYSAYFRILTYTCRHSVVFLYEKEIPALEPQLIGGMNADTKLELMRSARGRFQAPHRDYLERSHRQYVASAAWSDSGVDPEGHRRAADGIKR